MNKEQGIVQKFTRYSKKLMKSQKYHELKDGYGSFLTEKIGDRVDSEGIPYSLYFSPEHNNGVPFYYTSTDGKPMWLSWENLALDWVAKIAAEKLDESCFEPFWNKLFQP